MNTPALDHRRFMWVSLAAFFALLTAAALFNYFIDPYDLFGTKRIEGVNALKPAAGKHVRLAKPYMVSRFPSRTIIGGNSRPELGLDPLSACWPAENQPVFNLGIPGAGVFMQARMLQHAIASSPGQKKNVFWGLDFIDFLDQHPDYNDWNIWPRSHYEYEDRLSVTATGQPNTKQSWTNFQKGISTLFSIDTVEDSIYTLLSQGNNRSINRRLDGFNPARDYLDIIALEGKQVLFTKKNRELKKTFSRPELSIFGIQQQWSYEFETVRRTIEYLKQKSTSITLFINPYHVDYLTLIELTGRWKKFEQWKRQLQRIAETQDVPLWDFSTVNEYVVQQLPSESSKQTSLSWFWEPAHYKAEYGDLILQRMTGEPCLPQKHESAGIQLTSRNIELHLRHERDAIKHYTKTNPQ